jgi:hypothetical protein
MKNYLVSQDCFYYKIGSAVIIIVQVMYRIGRHFEK